ncbi:MAG: hypothetical protein LBQ30_00050, partial [Treponema sp.]|nr:hypothetical protein [Treponema sp.]
MKRYWLGLFSTLIILLSGFAQTNPPNPDTVPDTVQRSGLQSYRIGRDMEARGRMEEAMRYYNEAVQR